MLAEIRANQSNFANDFAKIDKIRKQFAPFIEEDPNQSRIRSYDPVLERYNFEEFANSLQQFELYEQIQLETFLGERLGVIKRPAKFITKEDGQVYSKDFPREPFNIVLQRGIEYRLKEGSTEHDREVAELSGWIKIRDKLIDDKTPLGSKFVVVSGPGLNKEKTNYPDNYVDIYEAKVDFLTKKRFIERKRFISNISWFEYKQELKNYDPNYFNNYMGPIDAWFLANPLFVDPQNTHNLFANIFSESKSKMPEKQFEEIMAICMPFINIYINLLCVPEDKLDSKAILEAYNAILVLADKLKNNHQNIIYSNPDVNIQSKINYLNQFQPENVMAGCGFSGGYNLRKNQLFTNSVARFSHPEWTWYIGDCKIPKPECGNTNVYIGPCGICEKCQEKFDRSAA